MKNNTVHKLLIVGLVSILLNVPALAHDRVVTASNKATEAVADIVAKKSDAATLRHVKGVFYRGGKVTHDLFKKAKNASAKKIALTVGTAAGAATLATCLAYKGWQWYQNRGAQSGDIEAGAAEQGSSWFSRASSYVTDLVGRHYGKIAAGTTAVATAAGLGYALPWRKIFKNASVPGSASLGSATKSAAKTVYGACANAAGSLKDRVLNIKRPSLKSAGIATGVTALGLGGYTLLTADDQAPTGSRARAYGRRPKGDSRRRNPNNRGDEHIDASKLEEQAVAAERAAKKNIHDLLVNSLYVPLGKVLNATTAQEAQNCMPDLGVVVSAYDTISNPYQSQDWEQNIRLKIYELGRKYVQVKLGMQTWGAANADANTMPQELINAIDACRVCLAEVSKILYPRR